MTVDESYVKKALEIHKCDWTVSISTVSPTYFYVLYKGKLTYHGQLYLYNNSNLLDISSAKWKFRHRQNCIEQWCQLHDGSVLSLSIDYYFQDQSVVIEYLARTSLPTRLDVRHEINFIGPSTINSKQSAHFVQLKRCSHGTPSKSIRHSVEREPLREAFSCTQWIELEKM